MLSNNNKNTTKTKRCKKDLRKRLKKLNLPALAEREKCDSITCMK